MLRQYTLTQIYRVLLLLAGPMSCRLVSVGVNVNSDLRKQPLTGRNVAGLITELKASAKAEKEWNCASILWCGFVECAGIALIVNLP